ncbi:MAG: hypothetical protein HY314_06770 [Acidobacteria bacterium]|nr:hypothetical protein [Acidobacteriota bacterium]
MRTVSWLYPFSHKLSVSLLVLLALMCGGSAGGHRLFQIDSDLQQFDADQLENLERKRHSEEEELARYDKPAEAQEYFLLKRLPVGTRTLPVEKYLQALEHMKRMPQYSTALGLSLPSRNEMPLFSSWAASHVLGTWEPLGPGNIGGRTRALLIDPVNPDIMYAAGVAGGVWKTTDGGGLWAPLADLMANLAVSSMAMSPADSNIIYAGTGEGYFNGGSVRGAGVFKTGDGGANWTRLESTNNSNFYFVNDLVVSPNDPQRIYAATRSGVWRSSDGGATWTQALNTGVRGGCLDLAIRTDQATDYLFASCGTFEQATVYRNTEAEANGGWIAVLSESGMGRTALAIAPSDQTVIYAVASSIQSGTYRYGLYAVFRSWSGGDPETWTAQVRNTDSNKLNTVLLSNSVFALYEECGFGSSEFYNQGWYDLAVAVDPVDPDRVWVGGIDLFRSDDGGINWGIASHWWASEFNPRYVHADQHVIVFHPQYNGTTNRIMFVGNDGGIFRTDNARAAVATELTAPCSTASGSVFWENLNNSYGVTQFYHGAPFPDGLTYFGGTQDNGTLLGTDQSGRNGWTEIMGGDGGYVAVDPTNTNILYVEFQGGAIHKSLNGGLSFSSATTGIKDDGLLFITPFTMDPSDPQRLWTGGRFLWRTTDGAASWAQASARVACRAVSALAVAPTNPDILLAGTSDGFILRTDIGLSSTSTTVWSSVQPREGFVSSIAIDAGNPSIVYATYSTFGGTHVWRSTDGGATWAGIDGFGDTAIPDIPVHTIVIDPTDPARLYVGIDLGVFVSIDGGATWAVENTGFANVVTEALALTTSKGVATLFAFTHGRGAWRVTVGGSR